MPRGAGRSEAEIFERIIGARATDGVEWCEWKDGAIIRRAWERIDDENWEFTEDFRSFSVIFLHKYIV